MRAARLKRTIVSDDSDSEAAPSAPGPSLEKPPQDSIVEESSYDDLQQRMPWSSYLPSAKASKSGKKIDGKQQSASDSRAGPSHDSDAYLQSSVVWRGKVSSIILVVRHQSQHSLISDVRRRYDH